MGDLAWNVLAWIALGVIIGGVVSRSVVPARGRGGMLITMGIGLVGAFLGGFVGIMIENRGFDGFSIVSVIAALIGAALFLWVYRLTRQRGA